MKPKVQYNILADELLIMKHILSIMFLLLKASPTRKPPTISCHINTFATTLVQKKTLEYHPAQSMWDIFTLTVENSTSALEIAICQE